MNHFKDVAAIQSVVLALGITRLLSSLVAAFNSRKRIRLDWIPLAWALCVFLWQLQYAWGIIELSGMVERWTIADFLALLVLPLLLFLAAALVLPSSELTEGNSLRASFEQDGRWGLLCISVYFFWSMLVNEHFWHISPLSMLGALSAALGLLPVVFLLSRTRRLQAVITLLYVALSIVSAYQFSPSAY